MKRIRPHRSLLPAMIALCLAASACASDGGEAVVEIGSAPLAQAPTVSGEPAGDSAVGAFGANSVDSINALGVDSPAEAGVGGLQYGASLDQYFDATSDGSAPTPVELPDGFREIQWNELIPPGQSGEEIYAKYEPELLAVEPGSLEADQIYEKMQAEFDNGAVNTEINGDEIVLAGFVAPLAYDGDLVTAFLLVPFFGACIHVPPPPVNQTIIVTLDEGVDGMTFEESWGAVWVSGTLDVTSTQTDIGEAGYSISNANFGVYDSF